MFSFTVKQLVRVQICSILHRFHPSDISASHVHVTDLKKLRQKQQQSKKEQQRILTCTDKDGYHEDLE